MSLLLPPASLITRRSLPVPAERNSLNAPAGVGAADTRYLLAGKVYIGYCPHPVTVYIRGPIKGYISP